MNIKLLNENDTESIFRFESENKEWFQKTVPARPNTYFELNSFTKVMNTLVAEQKNKECFLYLIMENNKIIGRVNISEIIGSCGEIGFRIAENYSGRGITTKAVKMLIDKAFTTHGLSRIISKTTTTNFASQKVLKNCGFIFTNEIKNVGELNNVSYDLYCYKLDIKM